MNKVERIYKKFLKSFNDIYEQLYNGELKVDNYEKLIKAHDTKASNDIIYNSFLRAFVTYRGDFVASDRECVAFWVAYESLLKRNK